MEVAAPLTVSLIIARNYSNTSGFLHYLRENRNFPMLRIQLLLVLSLNPLLRISVLTCVQTYTKSDDNSILTRPG